MREAIGRLRKDRRLTLTLLLTALQNFFIMGPAMIGTPLFIQRVLERGATSYAAVESCLGLGMVAGCFLIHRLTRRWNLGRILILGMIFDGVTHALVYWCHDLSVFMGLIAFHALGIPMIVVCRTSLVQEWVEERLRGRIFSLVNISVVGMTALSSGVVGWLAAQIAIEKIFLFFGIGAALCGLLGWLYRPLREA
jgi:predicted MFS family arabinose efflux permease